MKHEAPEDLSAESLAVWHDIMNRYSLEPHQAEYLAAGLRARDELQAARAIIKEQGMFYQTASGQLKKHPATEIVKNAHAAFLSAFRMLGIDDIDAGKVKK